MEKKENIWKPKILGVFSEEERNQIEKREIEESKKCLNETIQNTYAEGKAIKLDNLRKYIQELEQKEFMLDKAKEEAYWEDYIQKQKEAEEICKMCNYRNKYKKTRETLDKVTDKLKERVKELDNLKENYIKLKEYDQVDFTLCKKREIQNILNIIEGEKKNERIF